ncbi:TPA: competence type IV pilus major pilin ComGC [Staphylococcus aureus]
MFKFLKKTQAFTLIEMLLVLLIISLLLILIIPNIAKQTAHIQSTGCNAQVKMVNSQKHNRNPSSIEDLIADGFIKEAQKTCKSGETITISNGEAVAN